MAPRRAIVVPNETPGNLKSLVRQLSLDQLDYESRRVSSMNGTSPLITRNASNLNGASNVHKVVVEKLLKPRTWKPPVERKFFLTAEEISEMCEEVEKVFKEEETVLDLRAPVKIFGDLHGQFKDLMRYLFHLVWLRDGCGQVVRGVWPPQRRWRHYLY